MTPRLIMALGTAAAVVSVAIGLYWKGRLEGAARERPKIEAAQAQAALAGLEAQGERDSVQRVETAVRQREAAVQSVIRITHEALKSEDALAPLDPARVDRLRAADEQLCEGAPALTGCAPAGRAGGGAPAVRTVPPAGGSDAG